MRLQRKKTCTHGSQRVHEICPAPFRGRGRHRAESLDAHGPALIDSLSRSDLRSGALLMSRLRRQVTACEFQEPAPRRARPLMNRAPGTTYLGWGMVVDGRVQAPLVVLRDPGLDVATGAGSVWPEHDSDFRFDRGEEGFGRGTIEARPGPAGALPDLQIVLVENPVAGRGNPRHRLLRCRSAQWHYSARFDGDRARQPAHPCPGRHRVPHRRVDNVDGPQRADGPLRASRPVHLPHPRPRSAVHRRIRRRLSRRRNLVDVAGELACC